MTKLPEYFEFVVGFMGVVALIVVLLNKQVDEIIKTMDEED